MRGFHCAALAATSIAVAALSATGAQAKCERMSATGFGVAKEMAMEMAKMNLDMAITSAGQKSRGRTDYKCSGPVLMAECKASRRACS